MDIDESFSDSLINRIPSKHYFKYLLHINSKPDKFGIHYMINIIGNLI